VSLFGSIIFVLIQLMLLVDFAHNLNELIVEKYEESKARIWAVVLLAITIIFYAAFGVGTVLMYIYYTNAEGASNDCWVNQMAIIMNAVLCVGISLFSINPKLQEKNHKAGLLVAAVVTAYSTFLIWSALSSEPTTLKCSKIPASTGSAMFVGVIITFVSVVYSAIRVSSSDITGKEKRKRKRRRRKKEITRYRCSKL